MTEKNKHGDFFRQTLQESQFSGAQLARELNVLPQRIQHWQKRGVAAKYAPKVAEMLKVRPAQISNLEDAESVVVTLEGQSIQAEQGELLLEDLTPDKQLAAVLAIADSASPEDAITYAEYFLARAKAGLVKK